MASDKRKSGYTLVDKCKDEDDKLRKELAEQLRTDLKRLFTDRILTDLEIKAGGRGFRVHKFIFQEMGCDIYNEMMSLPESSEEKGVIVLNSVHSPEKFRDILSSFYTDDDIRHSLKMLRKYIEKSHPKETVSNSKDETDLCVNENENDNHCLQNSIKQDVNGPDDITTAKLEALAEKFVKQIIEDAQRSCMLGDSCIFMTQNGNVSVDRFSEVTNAVGKDTCTSATSKASTSHILNQTDSENSSSVVEDTTANKTELSDSENSRVKDTAFSRIPSCEISTSELIKKELNLKSAPKACSVLGEDLLRKLARGVACDCVVGAGDWEFPAHRCMLAARSSYFAMMLNGSWMESETEKIILEGVDAGVVKQMLLYIYGGVLDLDPACSIGGSVMVADMYDITGMKSIVSLALNKDYCHFFHKPCPGCIAGVPETIPLTMMYNMTEMCEKCLRWINRHKEKVWLTKSFALLPQECLDYCSSAAVKDLNIINIIESLLECQRLNEKIPRLKWTDSVLNCVATLMDAALEFASQNFVNIVCGQEFKKLDGKSLGFNLRSLEEIFSLVITSLAPGVACQSYISLHTFLTQIQTYIKAQEEKKHFKYDRFSEEYTNLVEKLCKKCKEQLCLYIHQAVNTAEWFLLSQELQKEIMDVVTERHVVEWYEGLCYSAEESGLHSVIAAEANYVCIDSPGRGKIAARPKLSSMKKKPLSSEFRVSMKEYFDKHFGPKETFPPEAITKTKSKVPKKVDKTKKTVSSVPSKETRKIPVSQTANQKTGLGGQKSISANQREEKRTANGKSAMKAAPKSFEKSSSKISSTVVPNPSVTKSTSNQKSVTSKTGNKEMLVKGAAVQKTKTAGAVIADAKAAKSIPKQNEYSTKEANYSLFANIRKEAAAKGNSRTFPHESSSSEASADGGGASPYMEIVSRKRSQSAGASTFKPHFGISPRMQTAQSVDSFFSNERGGQAVVVPKLLPTLNVKFVIPHEFYEQF